MSTFANPLGEYVRSESDGALATIAEAGPDPDPANRSAKSPKKKSTLPLSLTEKGEGRTLDLAERKWLQDTWFALDISGDGELSFDETQHFLRNIKRNMSEEDISTAFKEMDEDGQGVSRSPHPTASSPAFHSRFCFL